MIAPAKGLSGQIAAYSVAKSIAVVPLRGGSVATVQLRHGLPNRGGWFAMKHALNCWAVVVFAIALVASGCSPKEKPSAGPESPGTPTQSEQTSVLRIKDKGVTAKGGTLHVLMDEDFDSLDPADNYITSAQEVGRLIYRSLTFINDVPVGTHRSSQTSPRVLGFPATTGGPGRTASPGPEVRRRPPDHRSRRQVRRHALVRERRVHARSDLDARLARE